MARHHACFYSRWTAFELENSFDTELQTLTFTAQRFAGVVGANDSKGFDARAEGDQIRCDVARASEAVVLLFKFDHWHSRFGRYAIGGTPKIAVELSIADYGDALPAHLTHELYEPLSRRHTACGGHVLPRLAIKIPPS